MYKNNKKSKLKNKAKKMKKQKKNVIKIHKNLMILTIIQQKNPNILSLDFRIMKNIN